MVPHEKDSRLRRLPTVLKKTWPYEVVILKLCFRNVKGKNIMALSFFLVSKA